MNPNRGPWSLRWAFAWAVLVGDTLAISYDSHNGGTYRIDVRPARVRRWQERNRRRKAKEAGQEHAGMEEVFDV